MGKFNLNLYITRTITDTKTGKVIKRYRKRASKSFVKQFMENIEGLHAHVYGSTSDGITMRETDNTTASVWGASQPITNMCSIEAPANNSTYGLQIGTGVTAPDVSDYTVETIIAHGVGAGQMQYGACSVQSAGVVGATMELTMTRAFVNGSGGTIVVKECTIVVDSDAKYHLIVRDAVDDSVANGQTYTVTFTWVTTV